jgi:WD40 repeat protein
VTEVAEGEAVSQLAVSPTGSTVATGSVDAKDGSFEPTTIRLWRLDGSTLVATDQIEGPAPGFGLAFTPDGSHLVIGGTDELAIHRLDSGESVTMDLAGDMSRSLAVAPDGTTIAVGLWSGPIRLVDTDTGEPTGDDLRVTARVTDMAFRANGDELITVSQEGSIILWDLASRSRLSDKPLTAVNNAGGLPVAPSLAVGPNRAVTASIADGRLVTWSLNPDDWIAEGCRVHKRELTDAEKDRFDLEDAQPICESLPK